MPVRGQTPKQLLLTTRNSPHNPSNFKRDFNQFSKSSEAVEPDRSFAHCEHTSTKPDSHRGETVGIEVSNREFIRGDGC
ncbi:MAG: hypothetical protein V7L21_06345 [Nostoc sp.]|uniref:hypothetical protein n=1 Tax=Nostoc sp. TaxID=1180 RepID=UPI002FFCD339